MFVWWYDILKSISLICTCLAITRENVITMWIVGDAFVGLCFIVSQLDNQSTHLLSVAVIVSYKNNF